ncbi:MAG TPA: glycosyltransferase family 39 protein [Anaerolineae bacterium]|nr:glycosyltransferase family 39 protein [Anaerolineae bacterium]HQH39544.1 glycosyltransferase family 39 protein [Anaerolineae bacterium]
MKQTRLTHTLLIGSIFLLAFALRVAGLADSNIWWDEGIGVWLARMPLLESVRWTAGDVHPPLYYMLLHGWWRLVGEGEFVLRFPSVLCSLLAIPLIYRLGQAIGGDRRVSAWIALLAALFLALSRFAITWAQEIRMYALSSLLATGALWASVELWKRGTWRAWLLYVTMTLGCLYSLYLTVTVPLVANLGFLAAWWKAGRPRRMLLTWLAAQLAVGALFLPWIAYALPRMHSWASDSVFSPGFFVQLYATMLTVGTSLNLEAYWPLVITVFAVLGVGIGLIGRGRRSPAQTGALVMLLAGLLLPALTVIVISLPAVGFHFARPLTPRYLLPLSACFYVLLAWGMERITNYGLRMTHTPHARFPICTLQSLILLPVLSASIVGLWTFYPGRARRDDYTSIALTLEAHRQPGDVVLLYVDRDWPIFTAHYAGERESVPYGALLDAASAAARLTPLWEQAVGLWLVTTPEAQQTDPTQAVPAWLAEHALSWQTWIAGENALTFYARTAARQATLDALAPDFVPPANINTRIGEKGLLLGATLPQSRYRTGDTARLALYWSPPPKGEATLLLAGPATRELVVPAPVTAQQVTRQPVDILLTPDLPGGRYRLLVTSGDTRVPVGHFTLVRSAAGADIALSEIQHRVDVRLGESIRLLGYDLPQTTVPAGGVIELTLYWQTSQAIETRYKVFTHLLGTVYNAATDNFLWGQQDNEPGNGQALTTLWTPGAVIADTYHIPVDAAAPPGVYTLEIGMYGLVDVARLPVYTADGSPQGDALYLAAITVQTDF